MTMTSASAAGGLKAALFWTIDHFVMAITSGRAIVRHAGLLGRLPKGAAMTMTNASPSVRGRRVKFTPEAIEKIKDFVAEGISRDEIANRLGVTVGSLQVTCSRLGISLRRIIFPSCSGRRTADVRPGSVGIAHLREQKEMPQPAARAAPVAKFEIMMRCRGKEKTTDVPLPSPAIEALALEAISRDSDVAGLIGQVLVAAINKDMIQKILPDDVPPSSRRLERTR